MLCLGIESSCDETALALVKDGRLLDAVLASQVDMHALFGGVVPELASREHYRYMGPLYDALMARNGRTMADLDVVAVSRGPGLLGSLLVGVAFAKGLALASGARLVGVNHLHAHLSYAPRPPAINSAFSGSHFAPSRNGFVTHSPSSGEYPHFVSNRSTSQRPSHPHSPHLLETPPPMIASIHDVSIGHVYNLEQRKRE